jgi:hypothetical protein
MKLLTLTRSTVLPQRAGLPSKNRASFSLASPKTKILGKRAIQCAAASGDPYDVLGLPQNADYNAIQRAYKKKLRYEISELQFRLFSLRLPPLPASSHLHPLHENPQ